MEWDSPWGKGAPGWHLECSVMSEALLGLPFDIHTGGIDHREIHHPNEIAQNQARCGSDHSGARFWMHNNFLIERSGKMSKSSGEFLRVQLLIDKGFHPLAFRLMCLQAHYRSELEFSWEGLQAAFVRLKRMVRLFDDLRAQASSYLQFIQSADLGLSTSDALRIGAPLESEIELPEIKTILSNFEAAICADLNTADALVQLDRLLGLKRVDPSQKASAAITILDVLGLGIQGPNGDYVTPSHLRVRPKAAIITEEEIETALTARKEARAAKDFAKSDAIRDDLIAKGVEVMDGDPLGWDWKLDI
jgi:cysteinyl-tRNA synthetase